MSETPNLKITDKCLVCGFEVTLSGDDAVQITRAVDRLHNEMRPECDARPAAVGAV